MNFPWKVALILSTTVVCSSCDKAERLRAQQAEVEQKRSQVLGDIKVLEDKLRALGPAGMSSVEPIKRQAAEKTAKAALDESQTATLNQKWGTLGRQVDDLRSRADAWTTANQP
jgi:hypothetical protein